MSALPTLHQFVDIAESDALGSKEPIAAIRSNDYYADKIAILTRTINGRS